MADELLWKFEAFREYLTYEVLQPASAVLNLFEDEIITEANPRIKKLEKLLANRTGKTSWKPNRSGTPDISWNSEGDFTRNKERLLTSMLIMYPKDFEQGRLKLTPFGKALATGKVSRESFYRFLVLNFKYPHPAYEDNWLEWKSKKRQLYPFVFILEVLLNLFENNPEECFLSVREVEFILFPLSDHIRVMEASEMVISSRENNSLEKRKQIGDELTRKINDMIGFLCISGFCCYVRNNDITLNLHGIHDEEKTHYYVERRPPKKVKESVVDNLKSLISEFKNNKSKDTPNE